MGRLAGAALTAVAPEAKAASAAAGAARRRPAAADPRAAAPGSSAARQREQIEAIKSKRPAEPTPAPQDPADPAPPPPGAGPSLPGMPAAAATGSGFALGVLAWALALAYLQDGGMAGVRKWLKAKFFNITDTDKNLLSTGTTGAESPGYYTGGLTPGQFSSAIDGLPLAEALGTPAGQAAVNDPNGILGTLSGLDLTGIAALAKYKGVG